MSLLPSKPDTSDAEESAPRVIGVDSEDADELLAALSSETAREVLSALHDDPAPPSELADHVDTTLQNVQYHLQNLQDAGAIEVVDTVYSEKGREMDVYAPADRPLVIYAGDDDHSSSIRTALSRLLGSLGVLALGSVLVQRWFGGADESVGAAPGPADGESTGAVATPTETPTATETAASTPATPTASQTAEPTAAETTEEGGGFVVQDVGAPSETQTPPPETVTPGPTPEPETTARTAEAAAKATDAVAQATETAVRTGAQTTTVTGGSDPTSVAAGVPPGLVFFAGGAVVLLTVFALSSLQR